ncbi:hypothetical protein PIB30_004140 [Stylosanthes scabra]|uniref:Syringolide-induced protein 14-1-1 n=1 Tax=Stylosanthes scabra TaxID=79078 RepID=A0ABU6Q3F9_9FABA|nr:hypothetical protein [Stylosanthes scabra]
MEKHQLKLKSRILKILPKASSITVTFQNHPFSPGRWDKQHHHGAKGFSGPIVSMIPDEARRKPKGERNNTDDQEPTSPKISCMGQIKNKKKKGKKVNKEAAAKTTTTTIKSTSKDTELKKKHVSNKFQRMLLSKGRKSSASVPDQNDDNKGEVAVSDRAPHVSQLRKFASGRDTFANFDWKAHQQVAPDEEIEDFYSDEERVQQRSDEEEEDYDDDDDVRIPFSAPILVGGNGVGAGVGGAGLKLKPRKEINLWKRRTMAPPRPLQLNIN